MGNQPIKFSDYKSAIIQAIEDRKSSLGINEPVTLLDGFLKQAISPTLTGSTIIGGPSIPVIAVVGNKSGRLYYFALKALIPDLEV